jgi:hypothetical protein
MDFRNDPARERLICQMFAARTMTETYAAIEALIGIIEALEMVATRQKVLEKQSISMGQAA